MLSDEFIIDANPMAIGPSYCSDPMSVMMKYSN